MRKLFTLFTVMLITSTAVFANSFILNKGQFEESVYALHKNSQYNLWVTNEGFVFDFYQIEKEVLKKTERNKKSETIKTGQIIKLNFLGANQDSDFIESNLIHSNLNYIKSGESTENVSEFESGLIKNIYKNIDLELVFDKGNFRFNFIVKPGGNPNDIQMQYVGQDNLELTDNMLPEILLDTKLGEVFFKDIVAFQNSKSNYAYNSMDNVRVAVALEQNENVIRFNVGNYNTSEELVIDPMVFATYAGGQAADEYNDVFVEHGYIYTTGTTLSDNFPLSTGAYSGFLNGWGADVIVTKYDRDGSTLLYSTYIGGNNIDTGNGIVVKDGIATVVGQTYSFDFIPVPIQNSVYQGTPQGNGDGFIARLNEDGSDLIYATYFAGDEVDEIHDIVFDKNGDLVFCGSTNSDNTTSFPISSNAYQKDKYGGSSRDAFVSRMSYDIKTLIASTLFGDSGWEEGFAVAVDLLNNVYITGSTDQDGYATTQNALQNSMDGFFAAYVLKLNSNLSTAKYLTYFNGTGVDDLTDARAISVDDDCNIYLAGLCACQSFPATQGVVRPVNNDPFADDGFVIKFRTDSPNLIYATQLGGTNYEQIYDMEISSTGEAIVIGTTDSDDYHTTADAKQSAHGGSMDAFLTVLAEDAKSITYSTYLGDTGDDEGKGVYYDCEVYLAGYTASDNFPISVGANQSVNAGAKDGWLAKFNYSQAMLTLDSPADNAYNLNPFVQFGVSNILEAETWILQISEDANFESIVYEASYANTSVQLATPLEKGKTYYWRARRVSNGFCGDWSDSRKFKTSDFDWEYKWRWEEPDFPKFRYTDVVSNADVTIAATEEGVLMIKTNQSGSWDYSSTIPAENLDNLCIDNSGAFYLTGKGYDGQMKIYRSPDNGNKWNEYYTSSDVSLVIQAIEIISPELGFYTDDNGMIFKTADGGENWTEINPGTNQPLVDICYINSENTGWAVGESGTILKTTDGGDSWSSVKPSGATENFEAIQFADKLYGVAVAPNGIEYTTTDGGATWSKTIINSNVDFTDAYIDSPGSISIVGENCIYKKENGSWTNVWNSQTHGQRAFKSGYAVDGTSTLVGINGEIVETNLSTTFTTLNSMDTPKYNAVSQIENTIIIAGESVKIQKNGTAFADLSHQFTDEIMHIQLLEGGYAYAATAQQYMYRSNDKGENWTKFNTGINKAIADINFIDNQTGFIAMENDVYMTEDAGSSWQMVTVNQFPDYIHSLYFAEQTLYLTNNGLWYSNNMGISWFEITLNLPDLGDVKAFARKGSIAFIGGQNGLAKSTDGGRTWSYSKVENGMDIIDIEILNSSTIWALAQNGTVYRYNNGTDSWNVDYTKSGSNIKDLDAYNNINILAVGEAGSVLRAYPELIEPDIFKQTIYMTQGWNLISSYVKPTSTATEDVVASLDELLLMKDEDNQIYFPQLNLFQIDEFDYTKAYYIYCNSIDTLEIEGTYDAANQPAISLKKGWNLIGYTLSHPTSCDDAFESLVDNQGNKKYLLVRDLGSNVYFPFLNLDTIGDLVPGKGYKIYMLEDVDDFKYPAP